MNCGCDVYQTDITTVILYGYGESSVSESQWNKFFFAIKNALEPYIYKTESTCNGVRFTCRKIRCIKRLLYKTGYPFHIY